MIIFFSKAHLCGKVDQFLHKLLMFYTTTPYCHQQHVIVSCIVYGWLPHHYPWKCSNGRCIYFFLNCIQITSVKNYTRIIVLRGKQNNIRIAKSKINSLNNNNKKLRTQIYTQILQKNLRLWIFLFFNQIQKKHFLCWLVVTVSFYRLPFLCIAWRDVKTSNVFNPTNKTKCCVLFPKISITIFPFCCVTQNYNTILPVFLFNRITFSNASKTYIFTVR